MPSRRGYGLAAVAQVSGKAVCGMARSKGRISGHERQQQCSYE